MNKTTPLYYILWLAELSLLCGSGCRLNVCLAARGRGRLRVVHDDRDGTALGGNQRDAGITGHQVGAGAVSSP